MYWTSSCGRIGLNITKAQAAQGYHQGDCDNSIAELIKQPTIARQIKKLDPAIVAAHLKECGAWEPEELADHAENLKRLLWLACGDIVDGR